MGPRFAPLDLMDRVILVHMADWLAQRAAGIRQAPPDMDHETFVTLHNLLAEISGLPRWGSYPWSWELTRLERKEISAKSRLAHSVCLAWIAAL